MQQVELSDQTSSGTRAGDVTDDWLADVGEVDWVDTEASGGRLPYRPSTEPGPREPAAPVDDERARIQRRRLVAGLVALVVVGLAIAIPVIVLGGGGGGSAVVTETPPAATPETPAATPTPAPTTTKPTTTAPAATTAQTFTLPEGTKLEAGATGATVTQLQQSLTTLGYDPGKVDGDYGPSTKAAVVKFQTDKGLSPDGVVGPKTEAALNTALAANASG